MRYTIKSNQSKDVANIDKKYNGMTRQERLDALGVLHHVMARGIEQCLIFRDILDREDLKSRMSNLALKISFRHIIP